METELTISPPRRAATPEAGRPGPLEAPLRSRPIKVFMMDMLAIVPYYTGHLCSALNGNASLQVAVGSITYHLDRGFFARQGLRNNPGPLDLVSKLTGAPAPIRRVTKVIECAINLAALGVRFLFSKPDVVHVQFLPMVKLGLPFELWFLQMVRWRGIKVVYTVHNLLPQDSGARYKSVYRKIYRAADRLICHDTCAQDRLVSEFGIARERTTVIPHGPLLECASKRSPQEARKALGIETHLDLVLWQGILRPYKGVSFLLKAWAELRANRPSACLAIVGGGDPEMNRAVESEVAALGIESSVRRELRFVTVDELENFYLAADVIVYPYSEITTSGALMTGVSYGKPIVATKLPAFEQVLRDGENAVLVDYGNTGELADALDMLLAEPDLRQRLAQRARESYINGPQWPDIAQRTYECYRAALQGAGMPGQQGLN